MSFDVTLGGENCSPKVEVSRENDFHLGVVIHPNRQILGHGLPKHHGSKIF